MAGRIKLIDETEEFSLVVESSKIYYRRLSGREQETIIRRHEKRGKTNWTGALFDMVAQAITRWENVEMKGQVVEWDPSLVYRIPRDTIDELAELIGANVPGTGAYEAKVDESKNSSTTSGSNMPITG